MSKSYLQIYVFILPLKFFTIPQCRGLAPFPLQGHDTGPAPCMPPSPSSWLWPDGAASVQHMVVLAIFMGYVTHRDTIQIPFMKLKLLEISIIIPFYSHFSLVDLGWSKNMEDLAGQFLRGFTSETMDWSIDHWMYDGLELLMEYPWDQTLSIYMKQVSQLFHGLHVLPFEKLDEDSQLP